MTMPVSEAMRLEAHTFLRDRARQIVDDPQVNSVFALARYYFLRLEANQLALCDLDTLSDEISDVLIEARASAFRAQHYPDGKSFSERVADQLDDLADKGWPVFKAAIETVQGGIVFTAHPTFALAQPSYDAMAAYADAPGEETRAELKTKLRSQGKDWPQQISLSQEHIAAQHALMHAQLAQQSYARQVLRTARERFAKDWRSLEPSVPTIASWVGYDLDGRTDIQWWQSFRFRLIEKAQQLNHYAQALEALGTCPALAKRLRRAAEISQADAALFADDVSDPANLLTVVKAFEHADADRLVHAEPVIAELSEHIARQDGDMAEALMVLKAQIEANQMGTARVHLRVNAAQVRAVISRDLGLETEHRDLGRVALQALSKMASEPASREAKFTDLFLEQSTARRQILMCALWLQYIDAGSPIRFLIAEAENPATVMGVLQMARQYGIEDRIDISPLFETPEALETGGRFMVRLLKEPAFLAYIRRRGQLCIQLGFSDAGRFIGQVGANMAIERIHNLICQALADVDRSIALLIFNTHGESMGRGAWPGTFVQRYNHLLTPWTRYQARESGIALRHEVSFQGGDGYLHFATPQLAQASFFAWVHAALSAPEDCRDDPFYAQRDFTWDTYRSLRAWHERLFENPDYGHLLNDFATNFLIKAGSRQRRRTSGPAGPRALRAISHNATLQQLGVPVNTAAGIGSAIRRETSGLIELINQSPRMRSLIELAVRARLVTSLPALRAYASVFDPGFWVAISHHANDTRKATAYRRVYYNLGSSAAHVSINRVAHRFSVDLSKFDHLLASLDNAPSIKDRHEARLDLHVLHAIRQALMMHAMSLSAQLPSLSERHDTSLGEFMSLVRQMRIEEAARLLQTIFPKSSQQHPEMARLIQKQGDSPQTGYDALHARLITPLFEISEILQKLTIGIAQAYRAYG